MYLSSSIVRQVAAFGGDISDFICPEILDDVRRRLEEKRRALHTD